MAVCVLSCFKKGKSWRARRGKGGWQFLSVDGRFVISFLLARKECVKEKRV